MEETIRIGLMTPLTGLVKLYGPEISWAGQIACDEINESGGVLGKSLELVIVDDGSLPETAVPAAKELVDEHRCVAMIGNLLSNSRIAVANMVAEPRRIPHLNFSFYEGSIFNPFFFHFAALPNQQIKKMIPFMANRYGVKMFFAGNNYEWPRGSIDACKQSLEKVGGECVGEEYLSIGASAEEIENLLSKVARSGADVFVPYFAGEDQINLLNRFTELGLKKRMAVVMGHFDEAMASHLAPEVREGFYSSNTYFMSVQTDLSKAYSERLIKLDQVKGIHPDGNGHITNFGEGTYLCVKAFAEAAKVAGSLQPEDLIHALEHVQIESLQGSVRMDAKTHHAHINSYLSCCNSDGTFSIVEEFGQIPPEIPSRYQELFGVSCLNESGTCPHATSLIAKEVVEAHQSEGNARQVLSLADMAIISVNEEGIIIEVNRFASEMFGYSEQEMIGLSVHLLLPPHFRKRHTLLYQGFVDGEVTERRMGQRGEVTGYRKDGTFFPVEASIAKYRCNEKWVMVASFRELTELKRAQEELVRRATHDPLTGLPNRTLFRERLTSALHRSHQNGENIGLLFINLDGFREINDSYGHEMGDLLLEEVSQRLITVVNQGDTVGRLAGDEFIILCEHIQNPEPLSSLAVSVTNVIREPIVHDDLKLRVTASIGIALGHGSTHSADDLMRSADSAMNSVKERGRNGWEFFNPTLQEEAEKRLAISTGLRTAIDNNEFYARYQPIVDSESGMIRGAELLVRWRSSDGEISPGVFIPVAEMTGAIITIGRWVFEEGCKAERRWKAKFGEQAPYITINVSTRQLSEPLIIEEFQEILAETGADPTRIILEITETSLMADVSANREVLNRLATTGMRVAVDDFGTGYSSLAQLSRLKVNTLKIDREFVLGLDEGEEGQIVVSAISRLAKSLKLKIVAEGVETDEQRNTIRSIGCDLIQGYYYHPPLSEEALFEAVSTSLSQRTHNEQPLKFLIYISRPKFEITEEGLQAILKQSREFNLKSGITGYLFYLKGAFAQYLEGDEEPLSQLYQSIQKDNRHSDLKIIAEGDLPTRLFAGWEMGYKQLDGVLLSDRANLSQNESDNYEWLSRHPELCCKIFETISLDS
ncbi:EAL domain-containing protein [Magnetococcus marinus]|uniref:EAL domain-containing protein n=1 Tax=Magnetococcus marinus TaxID=1124597 RepID=UPI00135F1688|nr:EAL domain-containing protein [Magnetococcus marinus]